MNNGSIMTLKDADPVKLELKPNLQLRIEAENVNVLENGQINTTKLQKFFKRKKCSTCRRDCSFRKENNIQNKQY